MSATGRSNVRDLRDYYRTPEWCVTALLSRGEFDWLTLGTKARPERFTVLDAGCGDGSIGSQLVERGFRVVGVESDLMLARQAKESFAVTVGDFLKTGIDDYAVRPTAAIMNPPYKLAQEFVDHALNIIEPGGVVCALLRLGFLESKKRRDWWQANPADVYVLSRRPSFTSAGRTDASAYAWFVFGLKTAGRVRVL